MSSLSNLCIVGGLVLDTNGVYVQLREFESYMNRTPPIYMSGKSIEPWDYRCYATKISYFLQTSLICTYISAILLIMISAISVFGTIRENFKWLIFNQVAWDFLTLFSYVCYDFSTLFRSQQYCSDSFSISGRILIDLFSNSKMNVNFTTNSLSTLLLLSLARFIGVYFPILYQRITKKGRIFYWIFGFNLFYILTSAIPLCLRHYLNFSTNTLLFLNYFEYFKPIFTLFVSLLLIILVFIKFVKQSIQRRHQNLKLNHSNALLRVSIVLVFQIVLNFIVLLLQIFENLDVYIRSFCPIDNSCYPTALNRQFFTNYRSFSLADPNNFPVMKELRVLIEAILILVIVTEYRNNLFSFGKWLFSKTIYPSQIYSSTPRISQTKTVALKTKR